MVCEAGGQEHMNLYVGNYGQPELPENSVVRVRLVPAIKRGMGWQTEQSAKSACAVFNSQPIKLRDGSVCNFRVAQRGLSDFVLVCEASNELRADS